jgi:LysM repeat protein
VPEVVAPVPTNPASVVDTTAPTAGATEYVVAKGDTLSTIATKFHVTVKAIEAANPGVEPTKLQIGQKLHIPPPAPAAVAAPGSSTPGVDTNGAQIYTVKSGDTLIKIAAQFGTTPKAIRTANDLKTDSIKVGQKLKIPGKMAPTEPAPASPTTPPAPK